MSNLKSLIIGPTDKTKVLRYGSILPENYGLYTKEIGRVLAKNISQLSIIPDEGIPLDLAKAYKRFGGKKVVGNIPKEGYKNIEQYFQFCDEIEELNGGWTTLNTCLSLKNDLIIGAWLSPGTIVEIAYTKYHNKYLGKKIPILFDKRTISRELPKELEEEVFLTYFKSADQLDELLKNFIVKGI